jgi:hypothetical protein
MPRAQRIIELRELKLKEELESLKQERKEQARALKASKKWVSVKKRMPGDEDPFDHISSIKASVLVWRNSRLERGSYDKENKIWYEDDGTCCYIWAKDISEGITHWMDQRWRAGDCWYPPYGPGIKNRILYIWRRFTQGASDMAYDLRPKSWIRGSAQLDKKIVYYRDRKGKLMLGLPENYSAPEGVQKIVCNNVYEAERFSELQRRQERFEDQATMERREEIEGAIQKEWRSNAIRLMEGARNQVNRDFMEAALKRNEEHRPWEFKKESYLHQEGHEDRRR